jgi:hypothetical protein
MKTPKNYPLDEEIYMICFSQPRYPGEIQDILVKSGRTTQPSQLLINHPQSTITKLIKKGWIKELPKKENQKIIEKTKDGRAKRRQYIQSTLEPLIEHFNERLIFAKNEKRQLKHLFEKKSFRPIFSWENGFHSFDKVQDFLIQLTIWLYISSKYASPYKKTGKKAKDIDEKKMFSDTLHEIIGTRNEISERISPKLKIKITPEKSEKFYSFMIDISNKLKPPLSDKLLSLSKNNQNIFEIAVSLLAVGEYIAELRHKSEK